MKTFLYSLFHICSLPADLRHRTSSARESSTEEEWGGGGGAFQPVVAMSGFASEQTRDVLHAYGESRQFVFCWYFCSVPSPVMPPFQLASYSASVRTARVIGLRNIENEVAASAVVPNFDPSCSS